MEQYKAPLVLPPHPFFLTQPQFCEGTHTLVFPITLLRFSKSQGWLDFGQGTGGQVFPDAVPHFSPDSTLGRLRPFQRLPPSVSCPQGLP